MTLLTKAIAIYAKKKADYYSQNNDQGIELLPIKLD